ncbi:1015_t:CDS:2, partial [Racocetra fulgida]
HYDELVNYIREELTNCRLRNNQIHDKPNTDEYDDYDFLNSTLLSVNTT